MSSFHIISSALDRDGRVNPTWLTPSFSLKPLHAKVKWEGGISIIWSPMAYIQWFSRVLNLFQNFDLVGEILILYTMYFKKYVWYYVTMVLTYVR
jgi:hypothetical protein